MTTSINDNPQGMFAAPGLTSSSNGENCIILLFSGHPINLKFLGLPQLFSLWQ